MVPQAVSDKEGEDEAGEEDDEEEWKRERERDGEGEGEGEGEDDGELREGEDPRDPRVIARRKSEATNLDKLKRGRNFTLLPYTARPASLKFGIQPEYYVTYNLLR